MRFCIWVIRLQGWNVSQVTESPQATQCGNQTHLQDQALPITGAHSRGKRTNKQVCDVYTRDNDSGRRSPGPNAKPVSQFDCLWQSCKCQCKSFEPDQDADSVWRQTISPK